MTAVAAPTPAGNNQVKLPDSEFSVLGAFTDAATKLHAILGFPGVLLAFGLAALVMEGFPGLLAPTPAAIIVAFSLASSVATYTANRMLDLKAARIEAQALSDYKKMLLQRYLDSKTDFQLEYVRPALDIIKTSFN
ncbi:MAG TPA: hypothetical protein VJ914_27275 [Pseudonocardiaceae bacterium]|nr:hypothetical protein [Pseudonocardiaceae bacterium]